MAVLREDLTDRPYYIVCLALGLALVVAGVIAAITVAAVAWFTTVCGIALVAVSTRRLLQGPNSKSAH